MLCARSLCALFKDACCVICGVNWKVSKRQIIVFESMLREWFPVLNSHIIFVFKASFSSKYRACHFDSDSDQRWLYIWLAHEILVHMYSLVPNREPSPIENHLCKLSIYFYNLMKQSQESVIIKDAEHNFLLNSFKLPLKLAKTL